MWLEVDQGEEEDDNLLDESDDDNDNDNDNGELIINGKLSRNVANLNEGRKRLRKSTSSEVSKKISSNQLPAALASADDKKSTLCDKKREDEDDNLLDESDDDNDNDNDNGELIINGKLSRNVANLNEGRKRLRKSTSSEVSKKISSNQLPAALASADDKKSTLCDKKREEEDDNLLDESDDDNDNDNDNGELIINGKLSRNVANLNEGRKRLRKSTSSEVSKKISSNQLPAALASADDKKSTLCDKKREDEDDNLLDESDDNDNGELIINGKLSRNVANLNEGRKRLRKSTSSEVSRKISSNQLPAALASADDKKSTLCDKKREEEDDNLLDESDDDNDNDNDNYDDEAFAARKIKCNSRTVLVHDNGGAMNTRGKAKPKEIEVRLPRLAASNLNNVIDDASSDDSRCSEEDAAAIGDAVLYCDSSDSEGSEEGDRGVGRSHTYDLSIATASSSTPSSSTVLSTPLSSLDAVLTNAIQHDNLQQFLYILLHCATYTGEEAELAPADGSFMYSPFAQTHFGTLVATKSFSNFVTESLSRLPHPLGDGRRDTADLQDLLLMAITAGAVKCSRLLLSIRFPENTSSSRERAAQKGAGGASGEGGKGGRVPVCHFRGLFLQCLCRAAEALGVYFKPEVMSETVQGEEKEKEKSPKKHWRGSPGAKPPYSVYVDLDSFCKESRRRMMVDLAVAEERSVRRASMGAVPAPSVYPSPFLIALHAGHHCIAHFIAQSLPFYAYFELRAVPRDGGEGANELFSLVSKSRFKGLLLCVAAIDTAIASRREEETEKERKRERERNRAPPNKSLGLSDRVLLSLSPLDQDWQHRRLTGSSNPPAEPHMPGLGRIPTELLSEASSNAGEGRKILPALISREMIGLLSQRNTDGSGLLVWAAEEGLDLLSEGLLQLLPSMRAHTDSDGATALHSACLMGRLEVVRVLLQQGFDPLMQDSKGWTPLCYSLWREQVQCSLLLLRGLDSECHTERDRNALRQLGALGKLFLLHKKDRHLQNAVAALASVPEFFLFTNRLIKRNVDALHGDHLSFIFSHTNLLDLHNKLVVARKILQAVNAQSRGSYAAYNQDLDPDSDLVPYPIMRIGYYSVAVGTEHEAVQRQKEAKKILRGTVSFQFLGAMEAGCGPGVEREAVESFSRGLVTSEITPERGGVEVRGGSYSDALPKNAAASNSASSSSTANWSAVAAGGGVRSEVRTDQFALFRLQSSSNNKMLYSPVPIKYRVPKDINPTPLPLSSGQQMDCVTDRASNRNQTWDANELKSRSYDVKVCRLLRKGFRAFGQLVGHFILRKIAAAVDDQQVSGAVRGRSAGAAIDLTLPSDATSNSSSSSNNNSYSSQVMGGGQGRVRDRGYSLLSLTLPSSFWCLVLEGKPSLQDVSGFDPELYQNLLWVEENTGIESLSLYFTAAVEYRAAHTAESAEDNRSDSTRPLSFLNSTYTTCGEPLVQGGEGEPVTDRNKARYLDLMVRHCTAGRFGSQAKAVREGILSILPESCLELFNDRELELLLSGFATVDLKDWKQHTVYANCSASDQVMLWFWRLLADLQLDQLGLLLRFCTGCSRLPVGGFASLNPPFSITKTALVQRKLLPTAATCFNMLRLPDYKDEQSLRKHVMIALLHGSEGFSFA